MTLEGSDSRHRPGTAAVLVLAVSIITILTSAPAMARCTDPARPGVEWVRCLVSERTLEDVDLSDAVLRDSSFIRSNLKGATLTGIDGRGAKFIAADLEGADLSGSILREVDFTKANLSGTDLSGADLRGAKLFRADLKGAILTDARMDEVDLWRADLSGATWTDGETICAENSTGQCK